MTTYSCVQGLGRSGVLGVGLRQFIEVQNNSFANHYTKLSSLGVF